MSGCGGDCACAKRACEETKQKLGLSDPVVSQEKTCPCGKPLSECCKTTGKVCESGTCAGNCGNC